LSKYPCSSC